jgi:hypothetical protein
MAGRPTGVRYRGLENGSHRCPKARHARRGELFKRLPVGFALDALGKVVFHPDQRVWEAIRLVFVKFRELWSVRQTFQWFRDHDVELPANPIQGTRLVWKIPSQSLVRDILCNPFYAGAYVYASSRRVPGLYPRSSRGLY